MSKQEIDSRAVAIAVKIEQILDLIEEEAQKAAIKKNDKQPVCKTYLNTKEACAFLGCGDEKISILRKGIEEEIEHGRYGIYALSDNMIQAGVLIDYLKFRDSLKNEAYREYVPKFNLIESTLYAVTVMEG